MEVNMSKKRDRGLVDPKMWASSSPVRQDVETLIVTKEDLKNEANNPTTNENLETKQADTTATAPVQGTAEATPVEEGLKNRAKESEQPQTTNKDDIDHDWKKRADDRQRYINQLKEEKAQLEAQYRSEMDALKQQLTDKQLNELPKSKEELEAFAKSNPEAYNIMLTMAKREAMSMASDLEEKQKETKAALAQLELQKKLDSLVSLGHADAHKIWQDKTDLREWLTDQTPATKAMFTSPDVRDWAEGLTKYKRDRGIVLHPAEVKQQVVKQEKADASILPSKNTPTTPGDGKPKKKWSESMVDALSSRDYAKYRVEILEARRTGNFIYDKHGR